MIALFAPCCVSYLLPAYLGSVFKERRKVLLMTLVYSLGIFIVMMPAVLGAKAVSVFLFRYHVPIYLVAGGFMVLIGIISLLGLKLPMININRETTQKNDVASVFTLGIFSGITSACCAPVLAGVLALSFLTPTFWQAMLIGFVYVLGMVTPLYIGSYYLDSKKVLGMTFFKRKLGLLKTPWKEYPIIMGNLISFFIFTVTGAVIMYLTLATDFSMTVMASEFTSGVTELTSRLNTLPGAEVLFSLAIIAFVAIIVRSAFKNRE